jgi:hypothetical protein
MNTIGIIRIFFIYEEKQCFIIQDSARDGLNQQKELREEALSVAMRTVEKIPSMAAMIAMVGRDLVP